MILIKTTTTYFWLESKIYLKKVPVKTNNTIGLTTGFVNIYNLYKHSSKKTCG